MEEDLPNFPLKARIVNCLHVRSCHHRHFPRGRPLARPPDSPLASPRDSGRDLPLHRLHDLVPLSVHVQVRTNDQVWKLS